MNPRSSRTLDRRNRTTKSNSNMSSETKNYKGYIDANIAEYRAYQEKAVRNEPEMTKFLKTLMKKWLDHRKPLRLLDVGCGNGNTMIHFLRDFPAWNFTGIDVVPELIEDGRRLLAGVENARLEVGDALSVDSSFNEKFDVVLLHRVINTLSDQERALHAAYELVADGGSLVLSAHINDSDAGITMSIHDHTSGDPSKGVPLHVFAPSEFREMCHGMGVEDYEVVPFGMPVDLPKPERGLNTHTLLLNDGHRLQIAGGANVDHWKIVRIRKEEKHA